MFENDSLILVAQLLAQLNSTISINTQQMLLYVHSSSKIDVFTLIKQIKKKENQNIYLKIKDWGQNCSRGVIGSVFHYSNTMAATFMDFIKFGLDIKDLNQGQQIKWYLCQKLDIWLKILQILPKKSGKFWKKLRCYHMAFLDYKTEFLVSFLFLFT